MNLTTKTQGWIMTGLGGLIMLAATLPWISVAFFSINGLAGDGKISMGAGAIVTVLGLLRAIKPEMVSRLGVFSGLITVLVGLVPTAVFVVDFIGLSKLLASGSDNGFTEMLMASASPGIGLILTGILGLVTVALGLYNTFAIHRAAASGPEAIPA